MPTRTVTPVPPQTGNNGTAAEDIGVLALAALLGVTAIGTLGARVVTARTRR
jgi:hypothetical protein